jgi:hypothetical protein
MFIIIMCISKMQVADGNHVIEIFLKSWLNPLKIDFNGECCDSSFVAPCTFGNIDHSCETQFNICLQPSSFSLSNNNCPFGKYATNYDPSIINPDDITFTFGVSIGPTVPNPMTFDIFNKNKVRNTCNADTVNTFISCMRPLLSTFSFDLDCYETAC